MEEDNEININGWRISKERRRKRPTEKDRRRARVKLIKMLDEEKDRRRARRKMIKWVKEINEKERIRGVEIGRMFFAELKEKVKKVREDLRERMKKIREDLRKRMKKIRKRNINVMRRITEWTERKRRSERRRSERKRRRREERERRDRWIKMGIFRRRLGIDSVAVAFPIWVVYWIVWVIFFWINERAQLWTVFVFL